jgi:hypothetical protein
MRGGPKHRLQQAGIGGRTIATETAGDAAQVAAPVREPAPNRHNGA